MPWVRFTGDFDFRPVFGVTIAYRAGSHKLVTTACAAAAIAAGKAVRQAKPKEVSSNGKQA
ncbi:hypothetical protein GHV40_14295 [Devosia sp. D6-9]|nr:hypothetical protein GHV40_14295 [Devosia sp. D6-9]